MYTLVLLLNAEILQNSKKSYLTKRKVKWLLFGFACR